MIFDKMRYIDFIRSALHAICGCFIQVTPVPTKEIGNDSSNCFTPHCSATSSADSFSFFVIGLAK
jgi:hypothetical protein